MSNEVGDSEYGFRNSKTLGGLNKIPTDTWPKQVKRLVLPSTDEKASDSSSFTWSFVKESFRTKRTSQNYRMVLVPQCKWRRKSCVHNFKDNFTSHWPRQLTPHEYMCWHLWWLCATQPYNSHRTWLWVWPWQYNYRLWVENLAVCILWGNVGIVHERAADRLRHHHRNVADIKTEEMYQEKRHKWTETILREVTATMEIVPINTTKAKVEKIISTWEFLENPMRRRNMVIAVKLATFILDLWE